MDLEKIEPLELLEQQGYLLGFLGVMGGSSTSHTNAFFYPDKETLVLIDLSLLNLEKATQLTRPGLKRVYLCVTHLHADHASGIIMFCYWIRHEFPKIIPEIIVDKNILHPATRHFIEEGGRVLDEDYIFKIIGVGTTVTDVFLRYDMKLLQPYLVMQTPEFLAGSIPTTHAARLSGASGFRFSIFGKQVIYSGDTNDATPFLEKVDAILDEKYFKDEPEVELYIEASTTKWPAHLYFPRLISQIRQRLNDRRLKVILMHYNDPEYMEREVGKINQELCRQAIYLAKELF